MSRVAIIDYGLGNLFSIKLACQVAGLSAEITSDCDMIRRADALILPGVGAFGEAMNALNRLELTPVLKEIIHSGKPVMGVCLGMQLLMSRSYEFGEHEGLDIIKGEVVRFENPISAEKNVIKVPQVGWNGILIPEQGPREDWKGTMLGDLVPGDMMYFVHSYYIRTENPLIVLSTTRYGQIEYCSSFQQGNVFACQFHPERSGSKGLKIYKNFSVFINSAKPFI